MAAGWLALAALVLAAGAAWVLRSAQRLGAAHRGSMRDTARRVGGSGPVLLVTAHPDDECMFFTPTVRALVSEGVPVHVLCLSTGEAGPGAAAGASR